MAQRGNNDMATDSKESDDALISTYNSVEPGPGSRDMANDDDDENSKSFKQRVSPQNKDHCFTSQHQNDDHLHGNEETESQLVIRKSTVPIFKSSPAATRRQKLGPDTIIVNHESGAVYVSIDNTWQEETATPGEDLHCLKESPSLSPEDEVQAGIEPTNSDFVAVATGTSTESDDTSCTQTVFELQDSSPSGLDESFKVEAVGDDGSNMEADEPIPTSLIQCQPLETGHKQETENSELEVDKRRKSSRGSACKKRDVFMHQFICSECGGLYPNEEKLKKHMAVHSEVRPFRCDKCGDGFFKKSQLEIHERRHSGDRSFICDDCGKGFFRKCDLLRHIRTHLGVKPWVCEDCGKAFSQRDHLINHERTHSGEKPYACRECNKTFARSCDLNRHQLIHKGEKPHKCPTCGKGFTQKNDVKVHELLHTGERPFKCPEPGCGKGFCTNNHLVIHLRKHSNDRPFVCAVCSKGFLQSSGLEYHMRNHTGEQRFPCKSCGKKFNRKSDLLRHENKVNKCSEPKGDDRARTVTFKRKKRNKGSDEGNEVLVADDFTVVLSDEKVGPVDDSSGDTVGNAPAEGDARRITEVSEVEGNLTDSAIIDEVAKGSGSDTSLRSRIGEDELGTTPYGNQENNSHDASMQVSCVEDSSPESSQDTKIVTLFKVSKSAGDELSDNKPHKCHICGKGFTGSGSLAYHVRNHTGTQRYPCGMCGKRFNRKSDLTRHENRVIKCWESDEIDRTRRGMQTRRTKEEMESEKPRAGGPAGVSVETELPVNSQKMSDPNPTAVS